MSAAQIYEVLIVGYGPVGATLANLLGQQGHSVAIAEMHPTIFDKPRAINIDQETLRLWQRIGLADEISQGCEPHPGSDFTGVDGELIKAIYSAPPPYPLGWPANLMFVQPETEKILRDAVDGQDTVDVFLEHEAVSFEAAPDHVAVTFKTPEGPQTIRAKYLVGCDGANSPTRNWLGVDQTDLGFSEYYVVVDAWLTRDTPLPPRTTQFCRPDAPTSYVVCSGDLRRWELKILPNEDPARYQDQDAVNERLAPFVDVSALKFWRSAVYNFSAKVANTWHKDRVFLAGDAAHTMPPFLGQGLNSGMRDASNLFWKLSYVLEGKSSPDLLETYEVERRPHIMALTEITKELGAIVGETDPAKALERDKTLREQMSGGREITSRQGLIPALADGFLDADDALAGSLAPQPNVIFKGTQRRLDDLQGLAFALIEKGKKQDSLRISVGIERGEATVLDVKCDGPLMADYFAEHGVSSILVRPDGIVWASGHDLGAAILRLRLEF